MKVSAACTIQPGGEVFSFLEGFILFPSIEIQNVYCYN